MATYYRFQNNQPRVGEPVHCYTNLRDFKKFCLMMKTQDRDFYRMRFWEIEGQFIKNDEGDAVVRVISAKQISL